MTDIEADANRAGACTCGHWLNQHRFSLGNGYDFCLHPGCSCLTPENAALKREAGTPEPVPDITWDGAAHSSPARTVPITSKGDSSHEGGLRALQEEIGKYRSHRGRNGPMHVFLDIEEAEALAARISSLEGALAAVYADLPGGRNIQAIVEAALGDSDE